MLIYEICAEVLLKVKRPGLLQVLFVARILTTLPVLDLQLSAEMQGKTAAGLSWQQKQHQGVGCYWWLGGIFSSLVPVATQTAWVVVCCHECVNLTLASVLHHSLHLFLM